MGYHELDIKDRLYEMGYTYEKESVYDAISSSTDIFLSLEGPNDLDGRYLVEDTPCSLVAMAEIGKVDGATKYVVYGNICGKSYKKLTVTVVADGTK